MHIGSAEGWGPAPRPKSGDAVHVVFQCDGCARLTLAAGYRHGDPFNSGGRQLLVEPTNWLPRQVGKREFEDVPGLIADMATEAHQCLDIEANRAAVALARAVVEATAKERGIARGSLEKKIDRLFEDKHIREYVRDAAHEVRFGGNEVAHGDLVAEPMNNATATEILGLMDEILDEVFQSPARVARLKRQRLDREQRLKNADAAAPSGTATPGEATSTETALSSTEEPPF